MKKILLIAILLGCAAVVTAAPRSPRLGANAQRAALRAELADTMYKVTKYPSAGVTKSGKWTWTTVYTTNETTSAISIVSNGVKEDGSTKSVCFMWENSEVPFEWREKFLSLSETGKGNVLSERRELLTEKKPSKDVTPDEEKQLVGDDNITQEIRETQLRW